MRTIKTVSEIEKEGCVLTIGNFDGLHVGHREILAVGKKTAIEKDAKLVVMTFEPHPVVVLQPEKELGVLAPLEIKKHLLAEAGVDCFFVLQCDLEVLSLSARDFVNKFLLGGICPSVVVEGENFHFGSGRGGDVDMLKQLGSESGFEVVVVQAKQVQLSDGRAVISSSTLIRHLLQAGKVADAAVALDRAYRLVGEVVVGHGRGKRLGFPTANMTPARQIIPAEGVYVGFAEIADSKEQACSAKEKIPAALSIGTSSTYGDNPLLIEAHLLDREMEDLVGKYLAIDFVERIRSQKKFETEKELAEQITKDCERARDILATKGKS